MVKKAAKGGKKKKKPAKPPLQVYDLETSSKDDLKKYIALLEKELAKMRQNCALHSANKDRVMEFLYAKRESLLSLKQESVVKNTTMDDHIEQLRTLPRKKNEKTLVDDREEIRNLMRNSFENFVSAKSAETDHTDKEFALKQNVVDQYKRLEDSEFLYETTLVDANQRSQKVVGELEAKQSKAIENILLGDVDEILKLNQEFTTDKIEAFTSVWDADDVSSGARESFAGEIKRMQDFFHEISFNGTEVIKMLRDKLSALMRESNKVELNLKQMRTENDGLKCCSRPAGLPQAKKTPPFSTILRSKRNFESEKKLIALQYTNDILVRYLSMIEGNLNALKKHFTSAFRKVYQKADFRTLLIEEQILSMLRNEYPEPEEDRVKPPAEREPPSKEAKIKGTGSAINVLKLNFENSDTLFVPPVYHEFWNPTVKYLKN